MFFLECYVDEMSTGVFGLYFDCPCAAGYECQGTGMREVPKGEIGKGKLYLDSYMCTSTIAIYVMGSIVSILYVRPV